MEFVTCLQEIITILIYNKEQDNNHNIIWVNKYNIRDNIVLEYMEDNKYINECKYIYINHNNLIFESFNSLTLIIYVVNYLTF